MMTETFFLNWIATTPNFAAPLLLASLGLIISERAGVINLGAEGMMAVGAMSAVMVSLHTGQPWLSVLAGILATAALALVFAIAVVFFHANQVLCGLTVVALGTGITGIVGRPYVHQTITGFKKLDFGPLSDLPWIGKIVFQQDALIYLAVLTALLVWWGLMRSTAGLRLRAVGEDPATADIAGISIPLYRVSAVLLSGVLCGFAGAYLSIASSQVWVEGMIAGRGWIAVALVIFSQWHPLRAILGAVIFGGAEALTPRLLAVGADVPVYLIMMLPYLVTLAVLIATALVRRDVSLAPMGLGVAYLRQDRH
jgi:simple sugar transport system permease protein